MEFQMEDGIRIVNSLTMKVRQALDQSRWYRPSTVLAERGGAEQPLSWQSMLNSDVQEDLEMNANNCAYIYCASAAGNQVPAQDETIATHGQKELKVIPPRSAPVTWAVQKFLNLFQKPIQHKIRLEGKTLSDEKSKLIDALDLTTCIYTTTRSNDDNIKQVTTGPIPNMLEQALDTGIASTSNTTDPIIPVDALSPDEKEFENDIKFLSSCENKMSTPKKMWSETAREIGTAERIGRAISAEVPIHRLIETAAKASLIIDSPKYSNISGINRTHSSCVDVLSPGDAVKRDPPIECHRSTTIPCFTQSVAVSDIGVMPEHRHLWPDWFNNANMDNTLAINCQKYAIGSSMVGNISTDSYPDSGHGQGIGYNSRQVEVRVDRQEINESRIDNAYVNTVSFRGQRQDVSSVKFNSACRRQDLYSGHQQAMHGVRSNTAYTEPAVIIGPEINESRLDNKLICPVFFKQEMNRASTSGNAYAYINPASFNGHRQGLSYARVVNYRQPTAGSSAHNKPGTRHVGSARRSLIFGATPSGRPMPLPLSQYWHNPSWQSGLNPETCQPFRDEADEAVYYLTTKYLNNKAMKW